MPPPPHQQTLRTPVEADWKTIINALPLGLMVTDAGGRLVQYNQAVALLLDLPTPWLDTHPTLDELFSFQARRGDFGSDPEQLASHQRDNAALLSGEAQTERTHVRTSRQGRTIEVRSVRMPMGGVLRTFTDVTQQQRDQEALLEHKATHAQTEILAGVGTWRWRLDMEGNLKSAAFSPMAWTHFGCGNPVPESDCNEGWLSALLDDTDRALERLTRMRAMHGRGSYDLEVHLHPKNAPPRQVHLKGQVWITPDGQLDMVGVVQDVTERRQHEARLRQAEQTAQQANRIKTQFLANVSHEMRTPLNAVMGMFSLLDAGPLSAEQQDYTRKGQNAASALHLLVDDLLDVAHIETGQFKLHPQPCQLDQSLKRTFQLLADSAQAKRLKLSVQSPEPLHVLADSARLSQVLNILTGNAIKFTEQGEIQLGAKVLHASPTPPGAPKPTQTVRFWVTDTGMGIAPERQESIKNLFTQSDNSATRLHGGLGLGLGIADQIVHLMGSQLHVESALGQGSRFWFEVTMETVAPPSPAPQNFGQPLAGLHALVVEDNPVNQLVMTKLLESQGALVRLAHNGQEGVDAVRTAPLPFDVVLMDWQMPVMDGWTAAKTLRERYNMAELPIITVSANLMPDDIAACLAAGMPIQLAKPVNLALLVETLRPYVPKS